MEGDELAKLRKLTGQLHKLTYEAQQFDPHRPYQTPTNRRLFQSGRNPRVCTVLCA
jgi:hypothetical protein